MSEKSGEDNGIPPAAPAPQVNNKVAAQTAAKLLGPLNASFVPSTQSQNMPKRARFEESLTCSSPETIPETQVSSVHDLDLNLTASQERELFTDWNNTQASQITPSPVFGITATQYCRGKMDLALGDEAGTVQSYMDRFVSRFTPAKKGANTKEAFEHVLQASKTKYGAYRQEVTVPGQVTNVHSGKHRQYTVYVTEMIKRSEEPEFMKPTAICRLYKRDTRNCEDIRTILKSLSVQTGKARPEYKKPRLQNIYSNFVEAEAVLLGYDFGTCLDAVTKVHKPTLPLTVKTVGDALDAFQAWAESNDDLDKLTHGAGPAICTMTILGLRDFLSAHLDVKIDASKGSPATSFDLHDTIREMSKVIEKLRPAEEETDVESTSNTTEKRQKKAVASSSSGRQSRKKQTGPPGGAFLQQLESIAKTVEVLKSGVDVPDRSSSRSTASRGRSSSAVSTENEEARALIVMDDTSSESDEEEEDEDEEEDDELDDFIVKPKNTSSKRGRLSLKKNGDKVTSTSRVDGDGSSISSNDTGEEALNVSTSTVDNLLKENQLLKQHMENDRTEKAADKAIHEKRKAFDTVCLLIYEENRRLNKEGKKTSDKMTELEDELKVLCQTEEFGTGVAFESEVDLYEKATTGTVRPRACAVTKTFQNKGQPGREIKYVVTFLTVKNEPPSEDEIIVIGDDGDDDPNKQVDALKIKEEKVDGNGTLPTAGKPTNGTLTSKSRPENVEANTKDPGKDRKDPKKVRRTPSSTPTSTPPKKKKKSGQDTSHSLEARPNPSSKASSNTAEPSKSVKKGSKVVDEGTRRSSRRTADREKDKERR